MAKRTRRERTDDLLPSHPNTPYSYPVNNIPLPGAPGFLIPVPLVVGADPGGAELVRSVSARFTTIVGTLSTAAQPNITSLGVLTGLRIGSDPGDPASLLRVGGSISINQYVAYNGGGAGGGYVQIDGTPKLIISLNGTTRAQLTTAAWHPIFSAGLTLGTSALPWADVFATGEVRLNDAGNAHYEWYIGGARKAGMSVTAADVIRFTDSGGTVKFQLGMGGTTGKLIPPSTSFSVRNNADGVDNLLVKNAGEVDVVTGPLIIGVDPGAAGAASMVRIGGGLLVLNDPVPSASPPVLDDPGFRVGYTPSVFGGRGAFAGTLNIGHLSELSYAGVNVAVTLTGNTTQVGVLSTPNFNASATVAGAVFQGRVETVAAAYTMTSGYGLHINDASKGAGSAITTLYGIAIDDLTQGVTNISIKTGSAPVIFGTDPYPGGPSILRVGGTIRLGNGTTGAITWNDSAGTSSPGFIYYTGSNDLRFGQGNTDRMRLTNTALTPNTSAGLDFGSVALPWGSAWMGALTMLASPLNFTAGAGVVLGTTDANTLTIKTSGNNRWQFDTSGNLVADLTNGGYLSFRPGTQSTNVIKAAGVRKTWFNQSTTSTTANNSVVSLVIKGNTLATDGHALRVTVYGASAAQPGNLTVKFGATFLSQTLTIPTNTTFTAVFYLMRSGAATQTGHGSIVKGDGTLQDGSGLPTETLSGDVTLDIQGWVTSGGTLTYRGIVVEIVGD